jgi:hypothetical protein
LRASEAATNNSINLTHIFNQPKHNLGGYTTPAQRQELVNQVVQSVGQVPPGIYPHGPEGGIFRTINGQSFSIGGWMSNKGVFHLATFEIVQ